MALVNLNDVLKPAKEGKYGVGAFDFSSPWQLLGILQGAEELGESVIVMIPDAPPLMANLEMLAASAQALAKKVGVPVVLHLDHGRSLEACKRCLEVGFTGIMLDASTLPFEENIKAVKEVVALCRPKGIPVEAELGHVGRGNEYDLSSYQYTDPVQAAEFVKATEIDALAVAIGNAHGVYKGDPKINFEVLEALQKAVPVPLVLHGGSGIHDEDFVRMVGMGIAKLNFFTDLNLEAATRLKAIEHDKLDCRTALDAIRTAFKDAASYKMKLFGAKSKK
jgi:fructose-bisphosphate aldolase class II